MGCSLECLKVFGINVDHQWTTAAQDEEECHKTLEKGAEHFMVKWAAAEKVGTDLRHAVVCPNVRGKIQERVAQSMRRVLVLVRSPE